MGVISIRSGAASSGVEPGRGVGDQVEDRHAVLVAELATWAGEQALAPVAGMTDR
jgi:hypothetical protein